MFNRMFTFTAIAVGAALMAGTVPGHAFDTLQRTNTLTVNGPVALPGVTLAAGSYVFESGFGTNELTVVRVMSRNQQKVYFTGLTSAVHRPSWMPPNQPLQLGEARPGSPTPIEAWYPVGSSTGFRFRYE